MKSDIKEIVFFLFHVLGLVWFGFGLIWFWFWFVLFLLRVISHFLVLV